MNDYGLRSASFQKLLHNITIITAVVLMIMAAILIVAEPLRGAFYFLYGLAFFVVFLLKKRKRNSV